MEVGDYESVDKGISDRKGPRSATWDRKKEWYLVTDGM